MIQCCIGSFIFMLVMLGKLRKEQRRNEQNVAADVANSQKNDLVNGMNVANQNIKRYPSSVFDAEMYNIDKNEYQN